MLTKDQLARIVSRANGTIFENSKGDDRPITIRGISKEIENRGTGRVGIRGLGYCSHPDQPWPLSHIHEETDEYIVACCDAGCGTLILKKEPRKITRKKKGKEKIVLNRDGSLNKIKERDHESNLFE